MVRCAGLGARPSRTLLFPVADQTTTPPVLTGSGIGDVLVIPGAVGQGAASSDSPLSTPLPVRHRVGHFQVARFDALSVLAGRATFAGRVVVAGVVNSLFGFKFPTKQGGHDQPVQKGVLVSNRDTDVAFVGGLPCRDQKAASFISNRRRDSLMQNVLNGLGHVLSMARWECGYNR